MAIVDEIFNKKNGGQFFSGKKDQTWGGGPEGSLVKDHTFAAFFFVHPSLTATLCFAITVAQKYISQSETNTFHNLRQIHFFTMLGKILSDATIRLHSVTPSLQHIAHY